MSREVSRRTSRPPETKAQVSRPDIPGKRDLDPKIVEDRPDPVPILTLDMEPRKLVAMMRVVEAVQAAQQEINRITGISDAMRPAEDMVAHTTGYRDNNNGPEAIQNGRDMDNYYKDLGPMTDGPSKRRD